MSRIWQVAVKELYVFTEFMRLLGIQLFSIKSYSSCEIFLRLALEGGKATPAKAPSSTSPRSNLPREIWPSASVRTRGRDILVKSKTKILVKSLSRSPEDSPPGRCPTDSLAPVESSALDWFRPGTMSVGGLQPEDAPDSPAWSRFSDSERERKAARDRSRVLDNGTGGNKICHCRQMWWINYNWLVDMGGNLMFIWLEKIQGVNRFHPKPKGSPPKCSNSEIWYFLANEVPWV